MTRLRTFLVALAASVVASPGAAQEAAPIGPKLTAFPCGKLVQDDLGRFSDTFRFDGEGRELIAGCFVIQHPKGTLLWDTGLSPSLIGKPPGPMSLDQRIADRLGAMGLSITDVTHVGISHYHADHSGGAADYPKAELLIGRADWDAVKALKRDDPQREQLAPWVTGRGKVTPVEGDKDVFGDGSVMMLAMPGHTPGHSALLVRLNGAGPVLISGDQFHFRENRDIGGVPTFNTDRADTLASHDRFEGIARTLGARVVIQHDPRDMAALPAFPAGLE